MIGNIYQTFYDKLPNTFEDILPVYDGCKIVTCLNFYYFIKMKPCDYPLYEKMDYIASDGLMPIKMNKWFGKPKSLRLSFDLSSMAGPVFRDMMQHEESLYILGAKPGEVDKSVNTIKKHFPGIRIAGFHHGYISDCKQQVIDDIKASGAKICIIGMGAPMQDTMAVLLKVNGFIGTVYTCGGFIHQTQDTIISFPEWTNKLGLRWLYRIFTQKGVLMRILTTAPKFAVTYIWFLLFQCKVKAM